MLINTGICTGLYTCLVCYLNIIGAIFNSAVEYIECNNFLASVFRDILRSPPELINIEPFLHCDVISKSRGRLRIEEIILLQIPSAILLFFPSILYAPYQRVLSINVLKKL